MKSGILFRALDLCACDGFFLYISGNTVSKEFKNVQSIANSESGFLDLGRIDCSQLWAEFSLGFFFF